MDDGDSKWQEGGLPDILFLDWKLVGGRVWSGKSTKRAGVSTSLKAGYTSVTETETTPDFPPPSKGLS